MAFPRHLPLWGAVAIAAWLARLAVISFAPVVQLAVGGVAGGIAAVALLASRVLA